MVPLRVCARLRNGFAAYDDWSPTIDGILGYRVVRERLGTDAFAVQPDSHMAPVEGLPLMLVEHGELWWYACSSPIYDEAQQHRHYYHRRFDDRLADRYMVAQKARVNVKAGPYKAIRNFALQRICQRVTWHVVGDCAEIERLLLRVTHIGSRRGQGMGEVLGWDVTDDGDEALAMHHRPLPIEYAEALGLQVESVIEWGIRPPARLQENVTLCAMPT